MRFAVFFAVLAMLVGPAWGQSVEKARDQTQSEQRVSLARDAEKEFNRLLVRHVSVADWNRLEKVGVMAKLYGKLGRFMPMPKQLQPYARYGLTKDRLADVAAEGGRVHSRYFGPLRARALVIQRGGNSAPDDVNSSPPQSDQG